jgi:hypothetical protein
VPVIFRERMEGVSKMSRSIMYEAMYMVIALKLRSLTRSL